MRYLGTLGVLCWQLVDLVLAQNQTNSTSTSLPVVDLGYELYQATTFNETGGFYSFSNVRYGAPPTGDLRFRAPEPPSTNRTSVQTGEMGRICPQGLPNWILEGLAFVTNYTAGLPFDPSAFPPGINFDDLPPDPRTTEDCLFLDLIVHQNVLKSAGTCGPKAPVLVWIHGGGYAEGYKDMEGTPGKIMAEDEDTIFVAINYRLGAFGFISGPTLQEDGVANAGLLDQRLALEWVQQHIHKFGGDPERVTVMGESAGGGSILLQITAHGGQGPPAPFKSAIIQSPALFPFRPASYQENATQNFLALLNVSTIAEARTLPSAALIQANQVQTGASPYGEFVYGPEVDGTFVPEYIGKLLGSGRFDHSVEVIVAHNSDEGPLFTDPNIIDDDSFNAFVATLFPSNNKTLIEYVTNVLYPPIFDGSQLYSSNLERVVLLNSDILVGCNAFYLDTAFLNRTYAYLFAVPPGTHGSDLPYTFYNGPFDSSYNTEAFNVTVAGVLQDYILNFAKYGNPSTRVEGVGSFFRYGESAQVMELGTEGISMVTDPAANERCRWWQLGLDWHY